MWILIPQDIDSGAGFQIQPGELRERGDGREKERERDAMGEKTWTGWPTRAGERRERDGREAVDRGGAGEDCLG